MASEQWANGGDLPRPDRGQGLAQGARLRGRAGPATTTRPETVERTYTVEVSGKRFDVKVHGEAIAAAAGASRRRRRPARGRRARAQERRRRWRRRRHARLAAAGQRLEGARRAGRRGRGGRARLHHRGDEDGERDHRPQGRHDRRARRSRRAARSRPATRSRSSSRTGRVTGVEIPALSTSWPRDWLRIPSVSTAAATRRRCARPPVGAAQDPRRGRHGELVETGAPAARRRRAARPARGRPDRPDLRPLRRPGRRRRGALDDAPFEPDIRDGRLYARGASDDKGNFLPLLLVACELADAGELGVNVRVLRRGRGGDPRPTRPSAGWPPTSAAPMPRSSSMPAGGRRHAGADRRHAGWSGPTSS